MSKVMPLMKALMKAWSCKLLVAVMGVVVLIAIIWLVSLSDRIRVFYSGMVIGLSIIVNEDPQSLMQLLSPLLLVVFTVYAAKSDSILLRSISLVVSMFVLFLFINAFFLFPGKPLQSDIDIPNFPTGTIGLRAWKSQVEFKEVQITYGPWDTSARLLTRQRRSTWSKVWCGQSDSSAKFTDDETMLLKNCGAITDISDIFPSLGRIRYLTMKAKVVFKHIDEDAAWSSAQLVFRTMPPSKPKNKTKIEQQPINDNQEISEKTNYPWKYIALELHPKKPYYSKCWVSGEYPKQYAPKAYDNYYQRIRNLLKNRLWELKKDEPYVIYGTFYEGGWVRLSLVDETKEETKDITLYEGRIEKPNPN